MELDELSKDTLKSYYRDANLHRRNLEGYKKSADKLVSQHPNSDYAKNQVSDASRMVNVRKTGLKTAADKIRGNARVNANEEVEMDTFTIEDLVAASVAQKPGDFEEVFNNLILDKVATAVDQKKLEIAQTMFNPVEEE